MFQPDIQPEEGWIIGYGQEQHRITPATLAGPRLLVRVSKLNIRPVNRIGAPPLFRG